VRCGQKGSIHDWRVAVLVLDGERLQADSGGSGDKSARMGYRQASRRPTLFAQTAVTGWLLIQFRRGACTPSSKIADHRRIPGGSMERGTTGGKQIGRNATGRASLHHSKDLSDCFKQIVYLKQSPGFGVCIRDIGIDLFHGAGSDPTKPSI